MSLLVRSRPLRPLTALAAFLLAMAAADTALADPPAPPAGEVRTLESFAAALGVSLGGADDGPVFEAANKAIVAAARSGGLTVALPVGRVERTSVTLLLDNNGGYVCPAPGRCVVEAVRPSDSAAATWLVRVADPHATNLVLSGITFYGGWQWARAPYGAAPETDPWIERQGGVNIAHAFNGADDPAFMANSPTRAQTPSDHIENLVISGFGGDCLVVTGAGQNNYHNIRGQNCGGHGLVIDSYDNKFSDIDFGGVGRSCLFTRPAGGTNYIEGKVWYCGFRLKSADDHGVRNDASGNLMQLIVQDTYGDAIRNSGLTNSINAVVSWQGVMSPMDPGPISAYTCVGCAYNIVTLNASIWTEHQAFPNVTRLYRDLSNGAQYGRNNIVTISERGWPQDHSVSIWTSFWFEGPLEVSNRITLNGIDRIRYAAPGPSGLLDYTAGMNGSAVGTIVFGPQSANPGKVAVLCQGAGASACALQGFSTTATAASGRLRVSGPFAPGETVTIGGAVYTFDRELKALPGHVRIGSDAAASLANLAAAINAAGGTPGRDYAEVTVPDESVTASREAAGGLMVTARVRGRAGNRIPVSAHAAHATWTGPTLSGGSDGVQSYAPAFTWTRDGRAGLPNLPGPYADDAAAAAAGVELGELYRDAASVVHVRMGAPRPPPAAGGPSRRRRGSR